HKVDAHRARGGREDHVNSPEFLIYISHPPLTHPSAASHCTHTSAVRYLTILIYVWNHHNAATTLRCVQAAHKAGGSEWVHIIVSGCSSWHCCSTLVGLVQVPPRINRNPLETNQLQCQRLWLPG